LRHSIPGRWSRTVTGFPLWGQEMRFIDRLEKIWAKNDSLLCVGLDPDPTKIPSIIGRDAQNCIFEFCRDIIDATHDLVCAYKPQVAYFSALSAEAQLERTIAYIRETYPDIPVILDAKRGDIGSTGEKYAIEAFTRYNADAVTVNPYMGFDAVRPFLEYDNKAAVILCRTSNPLAGEIQDLPVNGRPFYMHIADLACSEWNAGGNCLLVVGGTCPQQMREIRKHVGNMPFLVPGIGAQGGSVAEVVAAGQTSEQTGLIINSSRGVLYAGMNEDFAYEARTAAIELRDAINRCRYDSGYIE